MYAALHVVFGMDERYNKVERGKIIDENIRDAGNRIFESMLKCSKHKENLNTKSNWNCKQLSEPESS